MRAGFPLLPPSAKAMLKAKLVAELDQANSRVLLMDPHTLKVLRHLSVLWIGFVNHYV